MHNLSVHSAIINSMALNPDGVLVSAGDDGTMRLWDYDTGYAFQRWETQVQPGSLDSEAGVYACTFDQTGARLITAEADKTIKVYREDPTASPESDPIDMATWTKEFRVQPTQEAQGLLQLTTVGPCAWGVQQVGQGAFQFFLPLPWHTAWSEHSQALQATLAWHRRSQGADVPVSLALHGCSLAPLALQAHLLGAVHILVACASDCQRREMAGMFALFAASFASPTPGTPGAAPGLLPRSRDILVLQYQEG
ncbi:Plrg1, partial [Symbiodinium sp. KB8]